MKNNFFTIFFIIFLFIIGISFFIFQKNSQKIFPEKNIVSVEKSEKILNFEDLLKEKKPEKIISKGLFLKENEVLTVAHGIGNLEDKYKIFFGENFFSEAKLVKKDEKNDFAILKTTKNFENFEKINFGKISENNFIFYFLENNFEKLKISKIENQKIFVKGDFKKGDSGTIFFNEKKEIIGILTEYDLKNKVGIINILDEKNL